MKRNTKEVRGSTSDIISNLPESIKATVLVCLPIQDAVRTSVLSTKWRYIWTKLPQLVFDDNFCRESARKSKTEIMMTIYQVLLLHRGPIPKFILNLSRMESCPEMDQLILFLSNNGIQEFTLLIEKGEPYKLLSSLFSCEQLRYLSLRSCVFTSPPEFKGFSRLVELVLYRVFVASDTLSSLISSCPLLEKLSLKRTFSSDCLEINAPNLRFLVCEIYGSSICLKNTARLARVSICFMGIFNVEGITQAETSKLVTLFGSLPVIEFLLLEYHTIRYMSAGGVPKRLPTTLNNLKTLKLLSICFEEVNEISVILCLIRSSPNLEKITIVVRRCETADVIDHALQLLEMQDWSDVSLNQLQVVELGNLSGTQSELKFIELLLAILSVLETMFIQTDSEKVADKGLRILTEAETSKLVTLFGSLPVIEFLQLEYDTVWYMSAGGVPKRLPTSLNNLKTLKLFFVCFEEVNEISVILCLIRSSPNLGKITIVASSTETADVIDPVLELLEMKDWSGVLVNQLQVVQLGGLYGTQSELKFIKLLLAISPVLETMFIQTDAEKVADEGLRILKEVT